VLEIDVDRFAAEIEFAFDEILERLVLRKLHGRIRLAAQSIGNLIKDGPKWRCIIERLSYQ
jgi:hypothetical protein